MPRGTLEISFRKFYNRHWDLIKQYEVSLSRMLNDILTCDQLQWFLTRLDFSSISWSLYRSWPISNFEWFTWNRCGMPAGKAYPSTHLIPTLLGTCLCPRCWGQFSQACHVFCRLFIMDPMEMTLLAFIGYPWLIQCHYFLDVIHVLKLSLSKIMIYSEMM